MISYRKLYFFYQVGLFIFGQYQLAGKLVFSHSFAHSHEVAQKHRRALNNTIKVIKPKLSFPKEYYVKGILKLPYGDIVEPFEAWYSGDQKMSRIDYYGGISLIFMNFEILRFIYCCYFSNVVRTKYIFFGKVYSKIISKLDEKRLPNLKLVD